MTTIDPNPATRQRSSASWPRIIGWLRPQWRPMCSAALLAVLFVASSMASPLILRSVIDDALPKHRLGLLILLCGAMIGCGALSTAAVVSLNILMNRIGQRAVHHIRLDVYDQVQQMPLYFFASEPAAEIQARMASDVEGISNFISFSATSSLIAVASTLAACVAMFVMNWLLAVICVALAVPLSLLNRRFNSVRRELAEDRQERIGELLQLVGDDLTMSGIILGRTFLRRAQQRAQFCATSEDVSNLTFRQRVAGSTARGSIGLGMACLPPLIYLVAGAAAPGLSLGTIIVIVTLQMRITAPIQQLLEIGGQAQSVLAMFGRIFEYLDMEPASGLDVAGQESPAGPAREVAAIRLRNVGCRYPASERETLKAIDLDILPGSTTVILGPTGSGKTTLALVLAGLLAPGEGDVRIRAVGHRPRQWHAASCTDLWQEVTLVAQEAAMRNASIRENLRFACPDAADDLLLWAADAMHIGDFITALPNGLDTMVGERGYQLSGGERQRLALARALLAPASVLVADEATSALDNATATSVHTKLRELHRNRALVIIAHRIPPLAGEDQVIVLSGGRMAYSGTHEELTASNSAYRRLLQAQTLLHAGNAEVEPFGRVSETRTL